MSIKSTTEPESVVSVSNLSKCYGSSKSPADHLFGRLAPFFFPRRKSSGKGFLALQNVSFQLFKGRSLGIIGLNGCGKSTLLQILAGTVTPTSGEVQTNGKVAALLELGAGFNPDFSGRENARLNASLLGLSDFEIEERIDEIIAFADIGAFIDQPVRTYSSGMIVRLGFAVVAHVRPHLLLVDEALAVGDFLFQQKCLRAMKNLQAGGCSLIFVSHSMDMILETCEDALLLKNGIPAFHGPAKDAARLYEKQVLLNELKDRTSTISQGSPEEDLKPSSPSISDTSLLPELDLSTGAATLLSSEILSPTGELRRQVLTGDTIFIRFSVRFEEPCDEPHFGFRFRDSLGRIAFGYTTYAMGERPPAASKGDVLSLRFKVQQRLAPGPYALALGCATGAYGYPHAQWEKVLFLHNDLLSFEVLLPEGLGHWEGSTLVETYFESEAKPS